MFAYKNKVRRTYNQQNTLISKNENTIHKYKMKCQLNLARLIYNQYNLVPLEVRCYRLVFSHNLVTLN